MSANVFIRRTILERDSYTCRRCGVVGVPGKRNGDVQVHHLVSERQGGRDTDENLVTLCVSCHRNADGLGKSSPLTRAPSAMDAPVSVKEAAQMLDCTPNWVCKLIAAGELPAHKLTPRQWIINRSDVEELRGRPRRPEGDADADA